MRIKLTNVQCLQVQPGQVRRRRVDRLSLNWFRPVHMIHSIFYLLGAPNIKDWSAQVMIQTDRTSSCVAGSINMTNMFAIIFIESAKERCTGALCNHRKKYSPSFMFHTAHCFVFIARANYTPELRQNMKWQTNLVEPESFWLLGSFIADFLAMCSG